MSCRIAPGPEVRDILRRIIAEDTMTTYTDRQKACIQAAQDGLMELSSVYVSVTDDEAAQFLAHLESTSPITGFSEPDRGAGDVASTVERLALRHIAPNAKAMFPDKDYRETEQYRRVLAFAEELLRTVPSQPAAPADRQSIEAAQRERINARFAARVPTPATADFDLIAPNDAPSTAAQGATLTDAERYAVLRAAEEIEYLQGSLMKSDGKENPVAQGLRALLDASTPVADSGASKPIGWRYRWPNSDCAAKDWSAQFRDNAQYCRDMANEMRERGAEVELVYTAAKPVSQDAAAYIQPDHLQKARQVPFLCRVEPTQRDDLIAIYTKPDSVDAAKGESA